MHTAKRTTVAGALALCLCAPLPAEAKSLDAPGSPTVPRQDLRGADARPAPTVPRQDLRGADAKGDPTAKELGIEPAPRVRIVEVPSSGLEWGDAGIGAAGMLGVVLVAGAALVATRHRTATTR